MIRGWLEFLEGWQAMDRAKGGSNRVAFFHSVSAFVDISISRESSYLPRMMFK